MLNHKWMIQEFQKRWEELPKLKQSKRFLKYYSNKRSNEILWLPRIHIRWIVGIFTGHGKFRYHLKKMKLLEDDYCRYCNLDSETAEHILCDCEALQNKRLRILYNAFPDPLYFQGVQIATVIRFLKEIKIFED